MNENRKIKIIAIGASAGGPQTVKKIIMALSGELPPIVVVIHMPGDYTGPFAGLVDHLSPLSVMEALPGQRLKTGEVYVAHGGNHLLVHADKDGFFAEINEDEPVNRFRPSVDVLFDSVADAAGKNALGILLTGMGSDGAQGLKKMHEAGALTIAQNQATSAVFGMPRQAIMIGAADLVCGIDEIIAYINAL